MSVQQWSTTASTNATADEAINLREGQAPSTVNDAIRAMMAEIAKWRDDLSGNLVTGGSATAYTLTTNQGLTSLTDGLMLRVRMSATNGAAATLNVDSLGAKAIAGVYGTAAKAGALRSGGVYTFTYDSTDDKWIVEGGAFDLTPTGVVHAYGATSAPAGWVRANGRTIGSASSGGTERANADAEELFIFLWTNYANAQCAVSSGRGVSAAADWAANKTIAMPDWRGRAPFGLDDMGNSSAGVIGTIITSDTTNGATGGAETTTIAQANLPNVTLNTSTVFVEASGNTLITPRSGSTTQQAQVGTGAGPFYPSGQHNAVDGHNHTVSLGGSGTALSNMPPAFLTTWIMKL
jgi:hypothetical protein